METTSARNQIESTLSIIIARDTAYRELADRFASLFETKEQVRTQLIETDLLSPDLNAIRMASGVSILAETSIAPWADAFKESTDTLLPVLAEVLQLEQETYQELQTYLDNSDNLLSLAQARIQDNQIHFENISQRLGITPLAMLVYIAETVSAPVLCAIASHLGKSLAAELWGFRHCPVCGSAPSIAQLCPNDTDASEYLVGGGGKKYLHCSLCGHDWHYKRNACVACGNDDSDTRELLFQDGMKHERIEVCHKCGKYMLSVDMREYPSMPHLDTIQMGLIHLDVFAHERQLTPISPTLWNNISSAMS